MLHGSNTSRLLFRRLKKDDYLPWIEFFKSPEALKYVFISPGDIQQCKSWIQRQLERYERDGIGLYALINEQNIMVGQAGLLVQQVESKQEIEISYHLIPRFWGNGYATEAARYCKEFAFANDLARSLISIIHIENFRSQKVALKNGMFKEKTTVFKGYPVDIFRVNV